jgi:thiamine pyrophosphokinase
MSSHHVVRDEQEPAILIDDPFALQLEFIELMLEWSPTVIVTANALNEVLHWGIKIDVVLAHSDQVKQLKPRLKDQQPIDLYAFETNDLLSAGFVFLLDMGRKAVNVMADIYQTQVLDQIREVAREMDAVLFYNNQKWVYVVNGFFQKWVSSGHVLGIHPVAEQTFIKTAGFYIEKTDEPFVEPDELVAETSGRVTIETNQKPFWLIEQVETDVYK